VNTVPFRKVKPGHRFKIKPRGRVWVKIKGFVDESGIRRNAIEIQVGRYWRVANNMPVYPVE